MPDGASVTAAGGALAAAETSTDNPLTIVTVSGAPLPDARARVGYPLAVHGEEPVLVTVTVPVIVPAAPWP